VANVDTAPKKIKPVDQTLEEPKYLKHLIDSQTRVGVRLDDDSEVVGIIEYYDSAFIRITREGAPNLFLFKNNIKYIYEI
jgi:host factor-I protein